VAETAKVLALGFGEVHVGIRSRAVARRLAGPR
jgi:hypothetical protein